MSWLESALENVYSAINPALFGVRRLSLQLEQFRNRDFSSMPEEAARVFKNTKLRFSFVPLAYRVSLDGTSAYNKAVWREFATSHSQQSVWGGLYRDLAVDDVLLDAEQAGVCQQSYVVTCLPDATGRPRLLRHLPYEIQECPISDPIAAAAGDLSAAERVVLSLPMNPPRTSGLSPSIGGVAAWAARIVLTRYEAYYWLPDGSRVGIYNDGLTNPLGRVPVVGTRTARPTDSLSWIPMIGQDVLSCQIGLILALSDCEAIMRSQSHVKVLLTGQGAANVAKNIEDTPDGFIIVDEPDVEGKPLALNPAIEKYLRAAETAVYLLSQYRYLRPEAYQASIVTGAARRADAEGFHEQQGRQELRTLRLEQEVARLIGDTYNALQPRALRLDPPALTARYRYSQPPENRLQRMQALALAMQQGLDDAFEWVAEDKNVSVAEAKRIVKQRVGDWRELFGAAAAANGNATPGLDKLAPGGAAPA